MDNHELLEELRGVRDAHRELATDARREIFNLRQDINDPNLSYEGRVEIERLLFDMYEMLKTAEDGIESVTETINSLQQSMSDERRSSDTETAIGVMVGFGILLFVLFMVFR